MSNLQVKESFSFWATNPNDITTQDLNHIKEALATYPYCQILHFLSAKTATKVQADDANETLRQSASFVLSRNALRKMVQGEFEWNDRQLTTDPNSFVFETQATLPMSRIELPDLSKLSFDFEQFTRKSVADTPPIDETTLHESNLQQDLSELAQNETVEAKLERERQDQFDIIDSFIENEALLGPIRVSMHDRSDQEDLVKKRAMGTIATNVVSEGMAKIMVRQGKIERAIEIYEQLLLKKPEKKAYFAEKIKELTTEE